MIYKSINNSAKVFDNNNFLNTNKYVKLVRSNNPRNMIIKNQRVENSCIHQYG